MNEKKLEILMYSAKVDGNKAICPIPSCSKEFKKGAFLRSLASHLYKIHDVRMCYDCGQLFKTKTALTRHVKKIHGR